MSFRKFHLTITNQLGPPKAWASLAALLWWGLYFIHLVALVLPINLLNSLAPSGEYDMIKTLT